MKLITAVIRPAKLDEVKQALKDAGITGLTVSQAMGFGRQGGRTEIYRGSEVEVDLLPKVRLEMVVEDRLEVERIVNVLAQVTRSGAIGDGKVWVTDVEWVVRLRTGEMNLDAL